MNFLELAQRFRREARITGTGPTTVISQTGINQIAVDWILQSYEDIQNLHTDWLFLQTDFTFPTIYNTQNYTALGVNLSEFGEWKEDSFRAYLTATGASAEYRLDPVPYDDFYNLYLFGAARTQIDKPYKFTVCPDKSLSLFPIPSDVYTVVGKYYKKPQTMTANSDIPIIPVKFHMIIVYRAMMLYGAYEAANEVYTHGQNEYLKLLRELERVQLPKIKKAKPLA